MNPKRTKLFPNREKEHPIIKVDNWSYGCNGRYYNPYFLVNIKVNWDELLNDGTTQTVKR